MEGSGANVNQVPCRILGDDGEFADTEILVVADGEMVQLGERLFIRREDLLLALGPDL